MLRPWSKPAPSPLPSPSFLSSIYLFLSHRPPWKATLQPCTIHTSTYRFTVGRTCQPHFSRLFAFFPSPSPIFLTHSPSSSSYILPVLLSRTPGCSAASWSHNNLPAHHESLPGFGFPRLSSERFQKGRQRPSRYRFVENLLRHLATHPSLFILRVSLVQRTGKNLSRNSLYLARSFVTRSIGWRILRYLPSFLLFVAVAGMLILKSVSRIRIEEWKVSGWGLRERIDRFVNSLWVSSKGRKVHDDQFNIRGWILIVDLEISLK